MDWPDQFICFRGDNKALSCFTLIRFLSFLVIVKHQPDASLFVWKLLKYFLNFFKGDA